MRLNLGAVLHVTHAYVGAMVDGGLGEGRHDRLRRRPQGRAHPGDLRRGEGRRDGIHRAASRPRSAQHGVTANCVALGHDEDRASPRSARARTPSSRPSSPGTTPIPRLGRPDDPALLVALLCSDAGALDHRPGVPGRRRLRPRALSRSPRRCVRAHTACGRGRMRMNPLWPVWLVLAWGYGFAPTVEVRARATEGGPKAGASRSRPAAGATTVRAARPTTASTRSAIGLAVFGLLEPARRSSPTSSGRSAGRSTPASAAVLGGARCSCRSRRSPARRARSSSQRRRATTKTRRTAKRGLRFGLGLVARRACTVVGALAPRPRQARDGSIEPLKHAGGLDRRRVGAPLRAGLGDAGAVDRARRGRRCSGCCSSSAPGCARSCSASRPAAASSAARRARC